MTGFVSQTLQDDHDLDVFDCGNDALNTWLRVQARRSKAAGTAQSYVWTRPEEHDVLAYFAVAPTQILRSALPSKSLAGGFSVIPGYLLGRLALDQRLHGQRLGGDLLFDAVTRIVEAARSGGGRLIAVDAIDEKAHAFYRRHGFVAVAATNRLYMKVSTAAKSLT